MLKRIHLIELEDLSFIPSWYRDLMTDCLEALSLYTKAYDNSVPILEKLIANSKQTNLVDFGSGGGGPWLETLLPRLIPKFPDLKLTLTDLFPNRCTLEKVAKSKFFTQAKYLEAPVNMISPPSDLKGSRIMFTSFHHLEFDDAKRVLQNAVNINTPIGIFEVTGRTIGHLLMTFIIPLLVLIITPFIPEKKLLRFVFTYLIPIVPLGCFWDGLASNFRTYSPVELRELVSSLENSRDYNFEVGEFSVLGTIRGSYLIGCNSLRTVPALLKSMPKHQASNGTKVRSETLRRFARLSKMRV